jgi:hypothetical protein
LLVKLAGMPKTGLFLYPVKAPGMKFGAARGTPLTRVTSLDLGVGTPLAAGADKQAPTPTYRQVASLIVLVKLAGIPEVFGWEAYRKELSGPQGAILTIGFPAEDRTISIPG